MAERQAQKERVTAAKKQKEEELRLQKESTRTRKKARRSKKQARRSTAVTEVMEKRGLVSATSKGRRIQRPRRFVD